MLIVWLMMRRPTLLYINPQEYGSKFLTKIYQTTAVVRTSTQPEQTMMAVGSRFADNPLPTAIDMVGRLISQNITGQH